MVLLSAASVGITIGSKSHGASHRFLLADFDPNPVENMSEVRSLRHCGQNHIESTKPWPLFKNVSVVNVLRRDWHKALGRFSLVCLFAGDTPLRDGLNLRNAVGRYSDEGEMRVPNSPSSRACKDKDFRARQQILEAMEKRYRTQAVNQDPLFGRMHPVVPNTNSVLSKV